MGAVNVNNDVDWIAERARLYPDKIAVIDGENEEKWTYDQLYHRYLHIEKKLNSLHVKAGDHLAFLAPNTISCIEYMFACRRIGAVFIPLNWRLSLNELNDIVKDCSPKLLIFDETYQEIALHLNVTKKHCIQHDNKPLEVNETHPPFPDRKAFIQMDSPWLMIYTGGTTGKPKGVVLSNRSVYTNALNTVTSWQLTADDITLTILPMFHTGGINALTVPILFAGGTVILKSVFEETAIVHLLRTYRCTIVLMVPTMYHTLVQNESFLNERFPHMKAFLSGGAPCPLSIYDIFQERGLPFKEGYGLTEAGPNNFFISTDRAAIKRGSVGKPMNYNDIKLVNEEMCEVGTGEVGEITILGEHVFDYYWNKQAETSIVKCDGWLLTGDLARRDEDGDYYILGRKKDMVITGGENVYPQEVENVICEHPDIKEVVVIGLPDEKWGEIVTAVINLYEEESVSEEDIKTYCSKRLAGYKVPKRVFMTDRFPTTHVGKIDKKALISQYNAV